MNNSEGLIFCKACHQRLPDTGVHVYAAHTGAALPYVAPPAYIAQDASQRKILVLDVPDEHVRQVIVPSDTRSEFVVGRTDETLPKVDVDYRLYGGMKRGVSRIHARFYMTDTTWVIQDLRSTNGTYLNGRRIFPGETFVVHNGDLVRFGKLELQVFLPIDIQA